MTKIVSKIVSIIEDAMYFASPILLVIMTATVAASVALLFVTVFEGFVK